MIALCAVAYPQTSEADKYYETARSLYVAGDSAEARVQLEKALAADPNHAKSKKLMEKIGAPAAANSGGQASASGGTQSVSAGSRMTASDVSSAIKQSALAGIENARADITSHIVGSLQQSVKAAATSVSLQSNIDGRVAAYAQKMVTREADFTLELVATELAVAEVKPQSASAAKSPEEKKIEAKKLYDKAVQLLDEEKYSDSKALLEQSLKLDPAQKDAQTALKKIQGILQSTEKKK